MTFDHTVADLVDVVESVGATIMVVGGAYAFAVCGLALRSAQTRAGSYARLRRDLGRSILLGLEVLIIADIIRTIVIDQTFESVVVLGTIVLVRIVLSFSLEVEIDGVWPWARWRKDQAP
jgi:uncharacterized membrane protein